MPSIMGNVRSLLNKMDELTALTLPHREYLERSFMCFDETWLNKLSPDSVVHLDGFHFIGADRNTTKSGKEVRGGGRDCCVC